MFTTRSRTLRYFALATLIGLLGSCGGGSTTTLGVGTITVTAFNPSPVPSVPTPFVITGSGFNSTAGTTAIVRFHAIGGTPFNGGASDTAEVTGTITSDTTITGTTPSASICGSASFSLEITVILESGVASAPFTGGGTLTVTAPTITAFATNGTGGGPGIARQTLSNSFTITGTGFGAVGSPVTVRFQTNSGNTGQLLFQNSTTDFVEVLGSVSSGVTITGATPLALGALANAANFSSSVAVYLSNGSCSAAFSSVTWIAPPVVSGVTNSNGPFDPSAPASILNDRFIAVHSTQMNIAGTSFQGGATVLVYNSLLGPGTPIGTGALSSQVTAAALVTGLTPIDAAITGNVAAKVRVTNPDQQVGEGTTLFVTSACRPNVNSSRLAGSNAEMTMSVNPNNPLNVVAFSHDLRTLGGFFSSNMLAMASTDGGQTWTSTFIGNTQDGFPASSFRGDPQVAFDAFGNLYLQYICSDVNPPTAGPLDRQILVQFTGSAALGAAAANVRVLRATAGTGVLGPGFANQDRNTLATGPSSTGAATQQICVGWVDFTTTNVVVAGFTSTGVGNLSAIVGPVNVAAPSGGSRGIQHCAPSVGPNGQLYVTWIDFDNSSAPAQANQATVLSRFDLDGLTGGITLGATSTVGTSDLGFKTVFSAQPNRGYGAIPMSVVIPTGPFAGRIVITYTDEIPAGSGGASTNTRVVIRFSDNNGVSWSAPIYVHPLTLNHHFHSWLGADAVTGNVYVTWYDTVDALSARVLTQRFCASSKDGANWTAPLLLAQGQSSAAATAPNDYLEYNGTAANNNRVYACWGDDANFTGDNPNGTGGMDVLTAAFEHKP